MKILIKIPAIEYEVVNYDEAIAILKGIAEAFKNTGVPIPNRSAFISTAAIQMLSDQTINVRINQNGFVETALTCQKL